MEALQLKVEALQLKVEKVEKTPRMSPSAICGGRPSVCASCVRVFMILFLFMSMWTSQGAGWEGGGCEGARVGGGCERVGRGRERAREGASGWDGWDGWDGTRVDSIFGLDLISHFRFPIFGLDSIFVFANYANSQAELHTAE